MKSATVATKTKAPRLWEPNQKCHYSHKLSILFEPPHCWQT